MNAPSSPVRFIHSSDWQLGMTRHFFHEEAAARFAQARIDAIGALGRLALSHKAQFIVVAGDVFESNQLSKQTLLRALDALKALPVPIFLLPGNHDPLDASSIFSAPEFQTAAESIIVLNTNTPRAVPDSPGVEVVGAPWRTKHPNHDLCAELADQLPAAEGVIRIAVAHGQVDVLSPDTSRPEIINLASAERAIEEKKFHYLALGDRHSTTRVGTSDRIWYSGAPVATAFDEIDPNNALLVELTQEGQCEVKPMTVGSWQFIAEHRKIDGANDLEQFRRWLNDLPNKEKTAAKISFEGGINLATAAALDELMDSQANLFGSLKRRQRTMRLAVVPDEFDRNSVALSGYAQNAWLDLLEQAKNDDATAQDALKLFYRLSQQAGT